MMGLLLNASSGDDKIYNNEISKSLTPDLEKRIISYRFKLADNEDELDEFFRLYGNEIHYLGRSSHAIFEFFIDKFFERLGESKIFDSVSFIEGQPGEELEHENLKYRFIIGGRAMKVSDLSQGGYLTEISRVVDVRKGKARWCKLC